MFKLDRAFKLCQNKPFAVISRTRKEKVTIKSLRVALMKMDMMKEQISELMKNQTHILEALKYLDERLKNVEDKASDNHIVDIKEILESQAMLDEIVVKTSDDILAMQKTRKENSVALDILENRLEKLYRELEETRKEIEHKEKTTKFRSKSEIKCDLCDVGFDLNSDLETHIKVNHENHKVFKCDKCDKCFVLNWRRDKHMKLHTNASVKPCHYFNNGGKCPFEELGCKFLHTEAKLCKSGVKCLRRLCPHRHPEKEEDTDCNVGEDILDETENHQ